MEASHRKLVNELIERKDRVMGLTKEELKALPEGSILQKSCPDCEGGERHIKKANGEWICLWCHPEEEKKTRGSWAKDGYCKDCGGKAEYIQSLNKLSCDTCENEEGEWM